MSDAPLRIIHCFRSPVGGVFRHIRDLIEIHATQGHHIGILCDSSTGTEFENELFEQLSPMLSLGLHRIPMKRRVTPTDLLTARKVYRQILKLQPDILHGHGAKGGAYVRLIGSQLRGSRSRVTRIYSPHGGSLHFDANSLKGKLYFKIERFLERWTDNLFFVSEFERKAYHDKVGKPNVPEYLIYNGVNPGDFEPIETKPDASDFLYIGMMRDLKGPDVFIEAVRHTEKLVGRPVTATMVGSGPETDKYQQMIDRAGLGGRIIMKNAMPARKAFELAQYVVVPSRAEAMPYIVLETIAANKPIIATNVGGIPEILGKDCDALIPPNDADRLAAVMALSLEEPSWLEARQPDRAEFSEKFSSQTMADQVMQAYQKRYLCEARSDGLSHRT